MISRRQLLSMGAAGLLVPRALRAASANDHLSEVERRISRHHFQGLTKEDIGTPALILDEALFQKNLDTMASSTKAIGINLRAHFKVHKCTEIAKKQIALGAIGICCATTAEAELLVNEGIHGVFHSCQPAGRSQVARAVALARRDPTFTGVVDDPITVDALEQAAAAAHVQMRLVVDIFAGMPRQGCEPGETALRLAQKVDQSKHLKLVGLMSYSGDASHTHGWETRRKRSADDLAGAIETEAMCRKSGLPIEIRTGGSTGTYNIDKANGLTELQAGSYVFMDTVYRHVGGKDDAAVYSDFEPALTVLTTVISKTHPNQCAIDYGNKASLRITDEVKGRPTVQVKPYGAEYGLLLWNEGEPDIKLGELAEIYPSNLDVSVNVFDRIYVTRGDSIVNVWPVMGRSGAPQR